MAGGFVISSSQPSNSGHQRREGLTHSLRSVTVKQIASATQAHSEADWQIDGFDIGHVTLVGQVVTINKQATNVVYMIDDGTGRVEARHWTPNAGEDEPEEQVGNIEENKTYARVTGHLKSFGQKRYINATIVRAVTDPHETYFHILDCIYTSLVVERGLPNLKNAQTVQPGQAGPSAYTAQSYAPAVRNQYNDLPPVARKVMEVVSVEGGDDGMHIRNIARAVGGDAPSISAALEMLMDDGLLFNTIDESHYKVA